MLVPLPACAGRIRGCTRVNAWGTRISDLDDGAVIVPGLDGLFLSRAASERGVLHLEALVDHYEVKRVPSGTAEILVTLETARLLSV